MCEIAPLQCSPVTLFKVTVQHGSREDKEVLFEGSSGSRGAARSLSLTWRSCDAGRQATDTKTFLKMQTTTGEPVTNFTTAPLNTATKSKEQILTQSSGAMIAIIVIGIIIVCTILLLILKTYNRRTHASRMMGGGSKPRMKSPSTIQTQVPIGQLGANSFSSSLAHSHSAGENGFRLPQAELSSQDQNNMEQLSTISESTVVTIHDVQSLENT
ncbi:hypothetical protein AAFF_G00184890 [Aldrovandia affinis]|uniref:Uncharacterized protein n=1 Tax=Aldrovandia affinis TaxID=143900 RepID=A0AAD7RK68_9TELE|nr:hypothetical protein AAFF_G00184890 [Aldrovandia affinis]